MTPVLSSSALTENDQNIMPLFSGSFPQCKTSKDQKFLNGRSAQKDKPCIFPFYYKGKRYNACTYDDVAIFSQRSKKYSDLPVGNFPWCATEVDKLVLVHNHL